MLKIILATVCCLQGINLYAQLKLTGVVQSASSGEKLAGATLQLEPGARHAIANEAGQFELANLPAGAYILKINFLGYRESKVSMVIDGNTEIAINLEEEPRLTDEVIVFATRATDKGPTTHTTLQKDAIQKQNFGQDLPFVLNLLPSVVSTSDAGAGVGYTGLRIRGSDATRINVTINGIPYNDSESQGVFWVNIPDIASSAQSIQVQRGVGSSTNGAGAFGASVNLNTNHKSDQPYVDFINSYGSFNTHRHTAGFGTGLLSNRFTLDGRASLIRSDGFIDRAASDLKSYYLSGGYYQNKTMVKAIAFGGHEKTYQSWYGVPQSRLENDTQAMLQTATVEGWTAAQTENLLQSNSRTFNFYTYENQEDNYKQDNYQLHFSHLMGSFLTANAALHYTYGRGFFEEFQYGQSFADYGLPDMVIGADTVTSTDLIRRRWLNNHFYGITYSLNYEKPHYSSVLGGGWNSYLGDHFGEVIWAETALTVPNNFRYYFNNGKKNDFNIFWKHNYQISDNINAFADVQYRMVSYDAAGVENDLNEFIISSDHHFFNPKIGITFEASPESQWYASYSVSHREPVREDFVNAKPNRQPRSEALRNLEIGWRLHKASYHLQANYYLMDYKNQLVLTGEINDVGAPIRTNVADSYREGVEIEGSLRLNKALTWEVNITVSKNKIQEFTEVVQDFGLDFDSFNEIQNNFRDTDISFSPSVIAGSSLSFSSELGFEVSLLSKYVGDQFLDNTANENRKIASYFVNDLRMTYRWPTPIFKNLSLSLLINNIFGVEYQSNGYTYGFIGGGETIRQNFYYPQAGRNYLFMVSMKF